MNLKRFDITIERGIINLGKYTFPKIFEFTVKVFDVFVRHSEK